MLASAASVVTRLSALQHFIFNVSEKFPIAPRFLRLFTKAFVSFRFKCNMKVVCAVLYVLLKSELGDNRRIE